MPVLEREVGLREHVAAGADGVLDADLLGQLLVLGPALAGVVETYLQTVPDRLLELWEAVVAQDVEAAGRAAHAVRGIGSCVAATRLAEVGAVVEDGARAGLLPTAHALLALHDEAERAGRALQAVAAQV